VTSKPVGSVGHGAVWCSGAASACDRWITNSLHVRSEWIAYRVAVVTTTALPVNNSLVPYLLLAASA